MLDNFSTFEELENHKVSQRLIFFTYKLKFEIINKLPRLSDNEKKEKEEILEQITKNMSDISQLNLFFDRVKQKYTNFLELKYIPSENLNELYDHLSNIEEHKYSLKNRFFSLSLFLKKMIEKTVIDEFDEFLEEKFKSINSEALQNYDGFWLNALFNCNFTNSLKPSVNDLIKYNTDFSSLSMIITVELFYNKVEQDLYTLLINRPQTKRLILKFEQRSYWVDNNIQPLVYSDDEEWNVDMNRVLNVFLQCVLEMDSVQTLSIIADKDCSFSLDKVNVEKINEILVKNRNSLEIFTLCRIQIPDDNQQELIQTTFTISSLKFLLFKAAKFTEKAKNNIQKHLNNKVEFDSIYFRFCKQCLKAV